MSGDFDHKFLSILFHLYIPTRERELVNEHIVSAILPL